MVQTLSLPGRRGTGFLSDYVITRTIRAGLDAQGLPSLRNARDSRGRRVVVKTWSFGGGAHSDLRAFWFEELRALRLLSAQRTHEDLLSRIIDGGDDENGFHIVVACGRRLVLGDLETRGRAKSWKSSADRVQLWRNLARVARAIGLLHDQGITHRNIDSWSVVTSGNDDVDFQLTGFEWATRFLPNAATTAVSHDNVVVISEAAPLNDWRRFGELAARLIRYCNDDASFHPRERALLEMLSTSQNVDGGSVERSINGVMLALSPGMDEVQARAVAPRRFHAWEEGTEAQGLLLLQVMQSLLSAATEFPVELSRPAAALPLVPPGKHHIHLRARSHTAREALSRLLNQRTSLSDQLYDALTEDTRFVTDAWYLVDESSEDDRTNGNYSSEMYFVPPSRPGERVYTFESSHQVPRFRNGLLVSARGGRSDQQFRRQLKAWRASGQHRQLFRALVDPKSVAQSVPTAVADDDKFLKLDPAKQEAVRAILGTRPVFLVQGPPGVGKTRMVAELCRQLVRKEVNTKMLFSAQSHAAVDNLLRSIAKERPDRCLLIRHRPRDSTRPVGEFDVQSQAGAVVKALRVSRWYDKCSHPARETIDALANSQRNVRATAERFHRSPIEGLLFRAANLVFGTANCAAFERLFTDRVQFDWSIIEEAAKATGNELLSPLQLSQRYLMIGDHKQLPPFNADELAAVLSAPDQVRELLQAIAELKLPAWQVGEVQRLQRKFDAGGEQVSHAAARVCDAAKRQILLFQNLIAPVLEESHATQSSFARMLTYQHRMHPAIADVVSHAFYGDKLLGPGVSERFQEKPPVRSRDPARLPDLPIVWVDVPWTQSSLGRKSSELRPGPYNVDEVRAVLSVVNTLQAQPNLGIQGDQPTLALLSPYRKQVTSLNEAIESSGAKFRTHLRSFAMVGGSYVHTVDSFQGSEASVVIVSLVRNNAHVSLAGALGFLKDERRMNVLFSRAEWRLIVVGSIEFLRHTVNSREGSAEADSVKFMRLLFEGFDKAQQEGQAATVVPLPVPYETPW